MKTGGQKSQDKREWIRPLWFLFTVGWYVALSLAVPTGIGFWLDRPENFNTRPLLTLIGFGLGTIVAFYGLYRMLRQFYLEQKESEKTTNKDTKL
jgi:ABC-type bacteriocin/lantibiotic exporter with double-glycine peptidase domain